MSDHLFNSARSNATIASRYGQREHRYSFDPMEIDSPRLPRPLDIEAPATPRRSKERQYYQHPRATPSRVRGGDAQTEKVPQSRFKQTTNIRPRAPPLPTVQETDEGDTQLSPHSCFMSINSSNPDVKRLRKVFGPRYDQIIQDVDAILTERCHLLKQIRALLTPTCGTSISAICERVRIVAKNEVKLMNALDILNSKLENMHGEEVYVFAIPYILRLKTFWQPIAELVAWVRVNTGYIEEDRDGDIKNKHMIDDDGAGLLAPMERILSILRSSGWGGLEHDEMSDLGFASFCSGVGARSLILDIHDADETSEDLSRTNDTKMIELLDCDCAAV